MSVIIGIDPGITGAIAVLDKDTTKIIQLEDMPITPDGKGKKNKVSGTGIKRVLGQYSPDDVFMVVLEQVHAMPGQGVSSMFSFGRSYGAIEAAVGVLGFSLVYVTPQRWKRTAGLIGALKDASRGKVLDLYPDASVHRKKDSGRADAVLIARYGIDC